jgi:hypothetical protein
MPAEHGTHTIDLMDYLPEVPSIHQHDLIEHLYTDGHGLVMDHQKGWTLRVLVELFAEPGQLRLAHIPPVLSGLQ